MLTSLKSKENLIKEILPELNALYKVTGSKPVIQYFDGIEGARFAQRRLLESKERAYYYYASVREFSVILGNTFMKEFLEERKKKANLVQRHSEHGRQYRFAGIPQGQQGKFTAGTVFPQPYKHGNSFDQFNGRHNYHNLNSS